MIANLAEDYSAHQILEEYKDQSSVEISLKFSKDPLFVEPVYLKKTSRVETLAYVFLIALLIFGALRIRQAPRPSEPPTGLPSVEQFMKKTLTQLVPIPVIAAIALLRVSLMRSGYFARNAGRKLASPDHPPRTMDITRPISSVAACC